MEPVQYLLYASMGASVASLGFLYFGLKQKKIKETTGNTLKEYKEQSTLTSTKNKIEDLINSSLFSSKREDKMEKDDKEPNFLRKYGLYGKKKSENIELEEDVNETVEEFEVEEEHSLFKKHSEYSYYEDNENFDDNYEAEIEKELEEEFINDFYGEEDSYEELEWKYELKNEHFLYVVEEEVTDLERELEEDIKRTAHKIQDEEFEKEYSYQSKESEEDRELRRLKEEIESEEVEEEEEELQIDVAKFLEEKRQKELENSRYGKVYEEKEEEEEEEEEEEIEENYEIFERETSSKSLEDEMDEFSEDDVDEDFLRRLNEISKKYD